MGMSSTTGDLTWAGPSLVQLGCCLGGQKSAQYPGVRAACGAEDGEAQGKELRWKAQPLWVHMAGR